MISILELLANDGKVYKRGKVGNTWGKQSLITKKGFLSYPGALFEGIAIITFRTSSLVTTLN